MGVTDVMGRSRGWLNAASPLKPKGPDARQSAANNRCMATIRSMIRPDAQQQRLLERLRKAGTKPWGSTVLASVICHNRRRPVSLPESCLIVLAAGSQPGSPDATLPEAGGSCCGKETGARTGGLRLVARAGSSRYSRVWTVAEQAVRAERFLLTDAIGIRLNTVSWRDREGQRRCAQEWASSRRSHVALNSLATARTRRSVRSRIRSEAATVIFAKRGCCSCCVSPGALVTPAHRCRGRCLQLGDLGDAHRLCCLAESA